MISKQLENIFLKEKEMNLALSYPSLGRFRVNLFYQRNSIGIVIRHIKSFIKSIDELKLPPILKDITMTKRGLVLVVGGTGSGKSTTLAAMIDYRNSSSSGHIITLEDPIEYMYQHKMSIINQREMGIDSYSFDNALKNAFRQTPDVIFIGEIRDTETMETAITFADTGHLCLGTLHSNNANQAIERIINFFPSERHDQIYLLLSLTLRAIIAQRLIPTTDGKRVAAFEIIRQNMDVGGPTAIHTSRKGFLGTAAATRPEDYVRFAKDLMAYGGRISLESRTEAMKHCSEDLFNYYKAIHEFMQGVTVEDVKAAYPIVNNPAGGE